MGYEWIASNYNDTDLVPENIKDSVSIFGVEGDLVGWAGVFAISGNQFFSAMTLCHSGAVVWQFQYTWDDSNWLVCEGWFANMANDTTYFYVFIINKNTGELKFSSWGNTIQYLNSTWMTSYFDPATGNIDRNYVLYDSQHYRVHYEYSTGLYTQTNTWKTDTSAFVNNNSIVYLWKTYANYYETRGVSWGYTINGRVSIS